VNVAGHDRAICVAANRLATRRGCRAMFAVVSRLGDGPAWYALATGLLVFGGERGVVASGQLALTAAASLPLYHALKRRTRRPRPCAHGGDVKAWIAPLDEFSFPSGHTLHAVAFTIVAAASFPPTAPLLWAFTALVALSRVILGLHYPSDVLAAIALGASIAHGVLAFTR
jgi:undecaprenyl-diphosphatase